MLARGKFFEKPSNPFSAVPISMFYPCQKLLCLWFMSSFMRVFYHRRLF